MSEQKSEVKCCQKFDYKLWNEKKLIWEGKLFLRDRVKSFFHIPLDFGKVVSRNMKRIKDAGALNPGQIMLADENSLWGADVFFAINKKIPNAKMIKISGIFLTKVFEGSFKDIKKWIKEMEEFVESKGEKSKKLFFFYTTCPKCAKLYGKNYVVILAKI